ncbi:hypothetical protein [Halorubrum lipolyticum]|uniref:DUF8162 domain-containing protein n=1 Tax=Halorubrum lipolyticum DSM 21995 TaxID=1227482 RepID=M0NNP3_9EURY|nr:hypothetical protein [Halorubrum lipolyticum]EMA59238.1 hypothetical protein C469_11436 [Halorubrum lipolyticum DSM 21995]
MVLGLASAAGEATGWLVTVALFALPGVVAAALWAPFLIAARFRALFVALPPAGRLLTSYVGVALALSVPYLAGVLLTVGLVDSAGAAWSNALVETALVGGALTTVVAPAVAVLALPRLGVDWDPTGYGASTWALLVAAGLWYAVVAAVPLFALAVVFGLPGGY